MPRTLIIGCGFIGSNVVTALAAEGVPLGVLTHSPPAPEVVAAIGESNLILGDAAEPSVVADAVGDADRVVFCAGGLLPAASERDPELDRRLTLAPVEATLRALERRPEAILTYLSSGGTVYGQPARIPVRETDPTAPISVYGDLHLACESMIAAASRNAGLRARVLRCATVYGEHQRPDRGQGAIVTFLHRIENGERIDLFGDGATVRDYIYVGDVVRVIAETMGTAEGPDVVNVGSGEGTSLLEILRLAEAQVGREANVARHPERAFDVHQIILDVDRLRAMTSFAPTSLKDGIARTHDWLVARARETA